MKAIVTGSGGLVGSEAVRLLCEAGWRVVGVDNNARAGYFGPEASTQAVSEQLREYEHFRSAWADITSVSSITQVLRLHSDAELVIHAAAQPSHDWSAKYPMRDFAVNAVGTVNLLEATKKYAPEATFCFLSTNKVYGDAVNQLRLQELPSRYDMRPTSGWYEGIPESFSIDRTTHSPFGVSKAAADLMTQEYGRYFGLRTVAFRCGCITGAAHAGAELHGFLAYLVKAVREGIPYTVYGYKGKQVRDNISGRDVARACLTFHENKGHPGSVYNLGGGRRNAVSVLEAIKMIEERLHKPLDWHFGPERKGDHRWWISDCSEFFYDFPSWSIDDSLDSILDQMCADG